MYERFRIRARVIRIEVIKLAGKGRAKVGWTWVHDFCIEVDRLIVEVKRSVPAFNVLASISVVIKGTTVS